MAVRLSPAGAANGVWDADPAGTFSHAARALDGLGLAFLHVVEGTLRADATSAGTASATDLLRCVYRGTLVSTGGYTPESGEAAVVLRRADLIGFGRPFIANPDMPERIRRGSELNAPERATFYTGGVRGYTDYPLLEHAESDPAPPPTADLCGGSGAAAVSVGRAIISGTVGSGPPHAPHSRSAGHASTRAQAPATIDR